jgi:hypothetical protein
MSLILSGTDGLSDIDGSAATPAIRGTDANTGIFFPAADTIAFSEGGVESMRIDSSGNVGIGTSSPNSRLDARTSGITVANFQSTNANGGYMTYVGGSTTYIGATLAFLGSGTSSDFGIVGTGANNMVFGTSSAEKMRIDSSGNVGIGTSSPSYKLQVSGSRLYLTNAGNTELMTTNTTGTVTGGIQALSNQSVRVGSITNYSTEIVANNVPVATATSAGVFQFNSGYGSVATVYGCRAWVNFNGTGTVAIRASGNVTDITDNGTGSYTVNLTTAMPDANYAVTIGTSRADAMGGTNGLPLVGSFNMNVRNGGNTQSDTAGMFAAVFR